MTPERDNVTLISPVIAIEPAVLTADNTPVAVDLRGFGAAALILAIGVGGITFSGSNKIEFLLTHSDDNSTYTAVTADDLVDVETVGTGGMILALTAAHAAATVHKFGYIGGKRYLKLLADFSGTHGTGTGISAVVARGLPSFGGAA